VDTVAGDPAGKASWTSGRVEGRGCALAAALAMALVSPRPVLAQTMRNVPLGGRTATMGGVRTAAGNDSAMPYVNPAGLAGVPGDIFAVSANVYGYSRRSVPHVLFPNGQQAILGPWREEESELKGNSVTDMPSSIMYFQHVGAPGAGLYQVFGMSLVIPNSVSTELFGKATVSIRDINARDQQSISLVRQTVDYYVGPSYAIAIDSSVRFGASVYALYNREVSTLSFERSFAILGGVNSASNRMSASYTQNSIGVVPVVGLQVQPVDRFWVGAAMAAPSVHLRGSTFRASGA